MLLGDKTSMADVLLMNMLARLTFNKAFFAKHVTSKNHLSRYWLAHKQSSDFNAANQYTMNVPSPCMVHTIFALVVIVFSALLACISLIWNDEIYL